MKNLPCSDLDVNCSVFAEGVQTLAVGGQQLTVAACFHCNKQCHQRR